MTDLIERAKAALENEKSHKLAQAFYRWRQRKIKKHEANPAYIAPDERWADIAPELSRLAHENKDLARALIREREAADRLAEILDAAITEHDTANYDYGEENPWTMGEWFTDEDRAVLAAYRKAQKESDDDK